MKNMIKKLLFLVLSLCLISNVSEANDCKIPIKIIKVIDGDTILAKIDQNQFKIRLYGIDCYESSPDISRAYKQAYYNHIDINTVVFYGRQATKELNKHLQKKDIKFEFKGIDIYGRALGILYDDKNVNINECMLKTPYCFSYNFKSF